MSWVPLFPYMHGVGVGDFSIQSSALVRGYPRTYRVCTMPIYDYLVFALHHFSYSENSAAPPSCAKSLLGTIFMPPPPCLTVAASAHCSHYRAPCVNNAWQFLPHHVTTNSIKLHAGHRTFSSPTANVSADNAGTAGQHMPPQSRLHPAFTFTFVPPYSCPKVSPFGIECAVSSMTITVDWHRSPPIGSSDRGSVENKTILHMHGLQMPTCKLQTLPSASHAYQ